MSPSFFREGSGCSSRRPWITVYCSGQEVIVRIIFVETGKLSLSIDVSAERLTIAKLLKGIEPAGNSAIAVGIESVEVYGCSSVDAGVKLRGVDDRLTVGIYDSRLRCAVGI